MKKNMGSTDKLVRLFIAIILTVLTYTGIISGTLAYVLLALAVVFVLTSFIGICPLYLPFGLNTRKKI
ncbi:MULTISPECIES: YgaP family membrane protein [Flavobacterium]|uniref:YgaP family membrane protein n=1 Tax=Flavobacterium TaxID=237 RepID=UPI002481DC77|nr:MULTISPECIES: DUF2892 domain-containing protein [Flavobacterium]